MTTGHAGVAATAEDAAAVQRDLLGARHRVRALADRIELRYRVADVEPGMTLWRLTYPYPVELVIDAAPAFLFTALDPAGAGGEAEWLLDGRTYRCPPEPGLVLNPRDQATLTLREPVTMLVLRASPRWAELALRQHLRDPALDRGPLRFDRIATPACADLITAQAARLPR
ncbi:MULTISPECIES: hypothetical protein [Actinomycetes]|uniref:AraC-like ligand-binding domain-containing protein n=1 Tax=Actinomycetes TaxID=1760 RepID=UPI0001B566DF|nr:MULTISPECIES: hypothetical protein [Actinomycetes]